MHSIYLLALFPISAFATLYDHCTGAPDGKATGDYLTDDICDYTTDCTARNGHHISNGCSFDDDFIKCCLIGLADSYLTNPCGDYSFCDWTANTDCKDEFDGHFGAGACSGKSNYQCCKYT